eukprot:TRINITY_DN11992_c0_g3_i1.p1 TRINITY_DN11992_c0_g3~~TRINITY_DN11992_c0_g3_i1.p1  ORF type:complete len:623 (+),score=93.79 TRINITY_DN11992_c0_g3_i1:139-2007(+)
MSETTQLPTFCKCIQPARGLMILCHACREQYHHTCIGISKDAYSERPYFLCELCSDSRSPSLFKSIRELLKALEKAQFANHFRESFIQKTYCICKRPDDGSSMIQCSLCTEWYHMRCIHLNPPISSLNFICQICTQGPYEFVDDIELENQKLSLWTDDIRRKKESSSKPHQQSSLQSSMHLTAWLRRREFHSSSRKHFEKIYSMGRYVRSRYIDTWAMEQSSPWVVRFHPTGQMVAVGFEKGFVNLYKSTRGPECEGLEFLERSRQDPLLVLEKDVYEAVSCMCFGGSQGENLATSSWSYDEILLHDVHTGRLLCRFQEMNHAARNLSFIDPTLFLSSSNDKTIRVWDTRQLSSIATMKGHGSHVVGATACSDPNFVMSASSDQSIRVWDRRKPERFIYNLHTNHTFMSFEPSADRRRFVCNIECDEAIVFGEDFILSRLTNLNAQPPVKVTGHQTRVWRTNRIHFSPTGNYLAGGSEDGKVCIWDSWTGALIDQINGFSNSVWDVSWSPCELDALAVCSEDHTFSLFERRMLQDVSNQSIGEIQHLRSRKKRKDRVFVRINCMYWHGWRDEGSTIVVDKQGPLQQRKVDASKHVVMSDPSECNCRSYHTVDEVYAFLVGPR